MFVQLKEKPASLREFRLIILWEIVSNPSAWLSLVYCVFGELFCFVLAKIYGNLVDIFWPDWSDCPFLGSLVLVIVLHHPFASVKQLLGGNTINISKSNVRNLSAYIIENFNAWRVNSMSNFTWKTVEFTRQAVNFSWIA